MRQLVGLLRKEVLFAFQLPHDLQAGVLAYDWTQCLCGHRTHLDRAMWTLRAMGLRVPRENLQRVWIQVPCVSRRVALVKPQPGVHARRRLHQLLPHSAHVHRHLLHDDRSQGRQLQLATLVQYLSLPEK